MSITDRLASETPEDELKRMVQEKIDQFHGLILEDSAKYLIALQKYGVQTQIMEIKDAIRSSAPMMLKVRVKKVYPAQIFDRGSHISRTQRVEVCDHTGCATVVCFDEGSKRLDEEIVREDLIQIGPLRYSKDEFRLMPKGEIDRIESGPRIMNLKKLEDFADYKAKVSRFFSDFSFNSGQTSLNGQSQKKLASSFEITDGETSRRVVLWDSPGLEGILKEGLVVELENAKRKDEELHLGHYSRLVFKKPKIITPIITAIEIGDKNVRIETEEKTFEFDKRSACIKLGAGDPPEGIRPETVLNIMKKEWVGKNIPTNWS